MERKKQRKLQIGLIVAIVVVVALVAGFLVLTREEPDTADSAPDGTLVETKRVERAPRRLVIHAQGAVEADREVRLRAEVPGRIVEVVPALDGGCRVAAGTPLVRIDSRDYEAALESAEAAVAQARSELSLELGRREIAEEEWAYFLQRAEAEEASDADRDLALREPQLSAAQARVNQALAKRRRAALDLERTVVTAPFDAVVVEREAAPGQLVSRQQVLATLVASDAVRVRAALPPERAAYLNFGDKSGSKEEPVVTVRFDLADRTIEFVGELRELIPALDPAGRMAEVLIEVPDPFSRGDLGDSEGSGFPLLLDAYVTVEIESAEIRELVAVPREAVHHGNQVYLLHEGALRIVEVAIEWTTPESVWVGEGLEGGERVVVSALSAPVEGMPLRPSEESEEETGETP